MKSTTLQAVLRRTSHFHLAFSHLGARHEYSVNCGVSIGTISRFVLIQQRQKSQQRQRSHQWQRLQQRWIRAVTEVTAATEVTVVTQVTSETPVTSVGLHRIRPPRMPAACNYGLNAGRTAASSAGGAAHRPAPVESVVDLYIQWYTAKPYASWPELCVNYGQYVRYSISSITIILTLVLQAKWLAKVTDQRR